MKRTTTTLAIALATLLAAPLAMAQSDTTSAGPQGTQPVSSGTSQATFSQLDQNGDGRISSKELGADASYKGRFATLDADHNGYISSSELSAAGPTGKSGTTTMGNADWSNDASGSGTSGSSMSGTSTDSSSTSTSTSTSGQDASGTQSDDSANPPTKP